MKNDKTPATIWRFVIALTVLLIWGQSLLGQELSNMQSGSVQGFLGRLFGEEIYHTFLYQNIRKIAHFAEYALLGAEVATYRLSLRCTPRPRRQLLLALGPAVAVIDELLQFISARAPRVTDVLLDCGGYAFGAAALWGIFLLWRRIYPQKSRE